MEVIIAFEDARAGGRYHRLEEGGWANFGGETDAVGTQVGEEAFEETNLGGCQHGNRESSQGFFVHAKRRAGS